MPQYAYFDSTVAAPSPVIGWYDTESLTYPTLPIAADLLALTAEQWAERMTGQWAVSNGALVAYTPPAPVLTLAQQAQAALAAGLTVTSTGTPALDGLYSVDAAAQQNIQAVQIYIQANGKFPGSTGTYAWLDKSGAAHVFPSVTEFTAFATAVADYVADLQMIIYTGTGTLPAATKAIA